MKPPLSRAASEPAHLWCWLQRAVGGMRPRFKVQAIRRMVLRCLKLEQCIRDTWSTDIVGCWIFALRDVASTLAAPWIPRKEDLRKRHGSVNCGRAPPVPRILASNRSGQGCPYKVDQSCIFSWYLHMEGYLNLGIVLFFGGNSFCFPGFLAFGFLASWLLWLLWLLGFCGFFGFFGFLAFGFCGFCGFCGFLASVASWLLASWLLVLWLLWPRMLLGF